MTTDAKALAQVSQTLNFFKSVIHCGENWSATCQEEFEKAKVTLAALAAVPIEERETRDFRCESEEFNGPKCKVQCNGCKATSEAKQEPVKKVERHPGPFVGPDAELAVMYGNDDEITHQRIIQNDIWADHVAAQAALDAILYHLRATPPSADREAIGWLIEWPEDDNVPVRWWNPATGWMRDSNKAMRFCRESDANDYINSRHFGTVVRATEHKWVSSLSPPKRGGVDV